MLKIIFQVISKKIQLDTLLRERLTDAYYSKLNWKILTKDVILFEAKIIGLNEPHICKRVIRKPNSIEIKVNLGCLYKLQPQEEERNIEISSSLLVSIEPDGSVHFSVNVFPSFKSSETLRNFILGYYPHSNSLAGSSGSKKIRCHMNEFMKLSYYSITDIKTRRSAVRFFNELESRNFKFRSFHKNSTEIHSNSISHETTLATGLVVGLLSSNILPMISQVGINARDKYSELLKECSGVSNSNVCLESRNHIMYRTVGEMINPISLLLATLALMIFALFIVKKYNRN